MNRRYAVLGLAGLIVALPGVAAAQDLVSAWQAAQQHDASFAAAQAGRQVGEAKQRQGRALFMPQVALSGSLGATSMDRDTRGAQFSAPGFGSANDAQFRTRINAGAASNLALVAKKPIYNAELEANASQLGHQAEIAELQYRLAQQELMLRTADAYFGLLLAQETLASIEAQKNAAARALEVAEESFDAGALPVTDRNEAQSRYDDLSARQLVVENDVALKRSALADITGMTAQDLKKVDPNADLRRYSVAPLAQWQDRAAERNLLLAMQRLGHEIAKDEIAKYRGLVSPSLDLVAQVADERMNGPNSFGTTRITSTVGTVGLQLSIPLVTGGMRSAKQDEALALAEKTRLEGEALRRGVLHDTQAAWLAVASGLAQIRAQEQALKSAAARLDATQTGQEVGARTTLDVVNAQADLYRTRLSLVRARQELLLGRLRLAASAGELAEVDVQDLNAALER